MPNFTVVWEIDLDAHGHADAVHQALAIQRDPQSSATVFTVHGTDNTAHLDLDPWSASTRRAASTSPSTGTASACA
ncbi:hypothetical protein [Streptomyces telluris]|uniref:Uncharacterized protein n=1 Tax=Streptomyces telluris TaxID=2720021 RepID=A0A9X2LK21_9ACTN|nr:hypothetical protein [Streptomyces telluris]MCQ8773106.1 hypothetical protein [Streptomyces telluris]NJP81987.1 hypothetical protein [Streptomyces telluris]